MNTLRDKVATVLIEQALEGLEEAYPIADHILAIPEIAEALVISDGMTGDFRDYLLRRGRWAGVPAGAGYV